MLHLQAVMKTALAFAAAVTVSHTGLLIGEAVAQTDPGMRVLKSDTASRYRKNIRHFIKPSTLTASRSFIEKPGQRTLP